MFNLASDDLAVKPYIPHKVYYNEFVVNALRDNIGSKKSVSIQKNKWVLDIKNLGSGQKSGRIADVPIHLKSMVNHMSKSEVSTYMDTECRIDSKF